MGMWRYTRTAVIGLNIDAAGSTMNTLRATNEFSATTYPSSTTLTEWINAESDEIVLCAKPIGGSSNTDVEGSITWQELS